MIFLNNQPEKVRNILAELSDIEELTPQKYPDFFREIINRNYRRAASEGLKVFKSRAAALLMNDLAKDETR